MTCCMASPLWECSGKLKPIQFSDGLYEICEACYLKVAVVELGRPVSS